MNPSKINVDIKKQLKYDKLNTKYNRLWEQITNFFLFFFASLIAYSVLFIEYKMNNLTALFISNAMLPLIIVLLIPISICSILCGYLLSVREELNRFLTKYGIML